MEVEPNDVVESDFEQQQQNVVVSTASSSSPRKGPAARSAVAFQGEIVPLFPNFHYNKLQGDTSGCSPSFVGIEAKI